MKPATKKQIKNGLRVGGQLGLFFVAAMIFGIAIDGIEAGAGHLKPWPEGVIAAGLIALATMLLLFTVRVWSLYIAGCLLFAIPKCLIVIMSGRDFYSPHAPFSRLLAGELLLFAVASLLLFYRVFRRRSPSIVDRLVLTLFMFSFGFGLSRQSFSALALWHMTGLAALILAWWLAQKRHEGRQPCRPDTGRS
jgi:hypothetical protein